MPVVRKRITLTLTDEDMGWIWRAFGSADDFDSMEEANASQAVEDKLKAAWRRAKPLVP